MFRILISIYLSVNDSIDVFNMIGKSFDYIFDYSFTEKTSILVLFKLFILETINIYKSLLFYINFIFGLLSKVLILPITVLFLYIKIELS